ncbi:MAG: FAD-dependent oxidoreductase [Pseudochelatococcus sp.]|jgi:pyruvate/2-oxoglutarate dehydrogenase complex dihydrolipoamide dehydrogenase (E3) component|uniref:FAD-dependent oxidoreductase n=1 Tax=Pseudochelatococcus sp. TaxID=2020869 RepID=UPI003D928912
MAPEPVRRPVERVDLCVLGPGAGGRLVAARAAEAGASVLHVSPAGGEANASGSAPPRPDFMAPLAFIEAASLFHANRVIAGLGLAQASEAAPGSAPPLPSGEGLVRHMRRAAAMLSPRLTDARLKALRVRMSVDAARFEDAKTLRVGERNVVARRFVLAPERQWAIPAIPGLAEIDYLTPDRPLVASRPAGRLAVIGFTDASLALAQAHRRLGSEVILLGFSTDERERAAAVFGEEALRLILMALIGEGVAVRSDLAVSRVEARGREARVHAVGPSGAETVDVGQVLVAPGTRAIFADPGWQEARIGLHDGAPLLDARLRTSNGRIVAIGADIGGDLFSATLERQADMIVDQALYGRRAGVTPTFRFVPTSPQVAVVGLTEETARREGEVRIVRTSFAWHPAHVARYRGSAPVAGEIKVIARPDGRILGCTIVGDGADDLAGMWALAVARRLKLADVAQPAFPDIGRHGLTRRATRLEIFGWPRAGGLLLRLSRWWRMLGG